MLIFPTKYADVFLIRDIHWLSIIYKKQYIGVKKIQTGYLIIINQSS